MELTASDNGSKTKQTSVKKFKLVITPEVEVSTSSSSADYEDEGGLDDDDEDGFNSRIVFNFYMEENNQAPSDLTHFTASDFEMLASSQGVKFEILMPSLPVKVNNYLNKIT